MMPEPVDVSCPYCGEPFTAMADTLAGSQRYIEDCPVCCRPIEFHTESNPDEDTVSVTVRRDDD